MKLGETISNFTVKHHKAFTNGFTLLGAGLVGLMTYQIGKLNHSDGYLQAYDDVQDDVQAMMEKSEENSETNN